MSVSHWCRDRIARAGTLCVAAACDWMITGGRAEMRLRLFHEVDRSRFSTRKKANIHCLRRNYDNKTESQCTLVVPPPPANNRHSSSSQRLTYASSSNHRQNALAFHHGPKYPSTSSRASFVAPRSRIARRYSKPALGKSQPGARNRSARALTSIWLWMYV